MCVNWTLLLSDVSLIKSYHFNIWKTQNSVQQHAYRYGGSPRSRPGFHFVHISARSLEAYRRRGNGVIPLTTTENCGGSAANRYTLHTFVPFIHTVHKCTVIAFVHLSVSRWWFTSVKPSCSTEKSVRQIPPSTMRKRQPLCLLLSSFLLAGLKLSAIHMTCLVHLLKTGLVT